MINASASLTTTLEEKHTNMLTLCQRVSVLVYDKHMCVVYMCVVYDNIVTVPVVNFSEMLSIYPLYSRNGTLQALSPPSPLLHTLGLRHSDVGELVPKTRSQTRFRPCWKSCKVHFLLCAEM